MIGYNNKQVQTELIESGFKPPLSPDCIHGGFTTTALEHFQPLSSPINLTLGNHTSRLATVPAPASELAIEYGSWSELVRRQVNLGDPITTSRSKSHSHVTLPEPGSWSDLVIQQVSLGDPTPPSVPHVMSGQDQRMRIGTDHHLTWDDLVKQGAILGDDGTDTLVVVTKAPLFE